MHGMSAYLFPVKERVVLALSGRSNLRDGFHVCNYEIVLPTGSLFVEVILKDYMLNI